MTERAEPASVLGEGVVSRLVAELHAAVKRKPAREALLGGAVSALWPLYSPLARGLAEARIPRAAASIARALEAADGGGLATLGAAALSDHPALTAPLVALSVSRHAHVAFAAEVARVARRESNGAHAVAVAPMISEANRIALCQDVLVTWSWRRELAPGLAPALAALRGAERHLGRWLLLAELGVRWGDDEALAEAEREAATGPAATRSAWTLVAWALAAPGADPAVRPTLELVTRLSDRPTADKDTSFLFRLASARVPSARSLLQHLSRGPLESATAVRAALHLARDFGDPRSRRELVDALGSRRREPLQGLVAAALYDLGEQAIALDGARELATSHHLPTLTFANLVLAAALGKEPLPLLTEPRVRRIQLGWSP
jgi:hypothetical protein